MYHIKYFIRNFIRQHFSLVLVTFSVGLLANLVTLFIPILIARSYELLFAISSNRGQLIGFLPTYFFTSINSFLLLFVGCVLIKLIIDFSYKYLLAKLGELHVKEIRETLFAHQLNLSMSIYDQKGVGRYLLRFSGDLSSIQQFLTRGVIRLVSDLLLIAGAVGLLYYLNHLLGIIILGFCIIITLIVSVLNRWLYQTSVNKRNLKSRLLTFVSQRLHSILTIKSFNRQVPENKRFERLSNKSYQAGLSYQWVQSGISALIPFALYLMIGVILYIIYWQQSINQQVIDSNTMFILVLLLISLLPVFRRVFRVSMVWKKGGISYQKLCVILNAPTDNFADRPNLKYAAGRIEIKNLTFDYSASQHQIHHFNATILPKSITLIQGESGAGKTTLAKLLLGIITPTAGVIYFDQQSTADISTKSLRRKIAVVGTAWTLLGKSVFEVLSYSRNRRNRPKVATALQSIQSPTLAFKPLVVDDKIGDYANNLSTGEKMMLNFTRAILTNKPILILDNPFDGLDDNLKVHLVGLINQIKKEKTIVWLDKKQNRNLLKVDACFVLDKGRIPPKYSTLTTSKTL